MKFGLVVLQPSIRKMKYDKGWKRIGTNLIHESVVWDDDLELGEHNTIYPNTVIGLPGFIREAETASGRVIIGNNNRIGCNVCIMIGASGITSIGDNNLIMNYVNIGHNVQIGNDNEIGVQSILAGWVQIGNNNQIKLSCNLRNRIVLGNGHTVGMGSNVTKSFPNDGLLLYGNPATERPRITAS